MSIEYSIAERVKLIRRLPQVRDLSWRHEPDIIPKSEADQKHLNSSFSGNEDDDDLDSVHSAETVILDSEDFPPDVSAPDASPATDEGPVKTAALSTATEDDIKGDLIIELETLAVLNDVQSSSGPSGVGGPKKSPGRAASRDRKRKPAILKQHSCHFCPMRFSRANYFRSHLSTHTGENAYRCSVCPKTYAHLSSLRLHTRVHTGEKPYGCQLCPRRFSRVDNLQSHQRVHTGEKPYGCQICSRRFSRLGNLQSHQRVHTGEKPYSCSYCSKSFARANSLRLHKDRIHMKEILATTRST